MKIRTKLLHPAAQLPRYMTPGAAAFDLVACTVNGLTQVGDIVYPGHPVIVGTGLAMEIPDGYMLEIRSRSGLAFLHGVTAFPGVIDSDFRGEIKVLLTCWHLEDEEPPHKVMPGDRIAQAVLVPVPMCAFEAVNELTPTKRGEAGIGSTGVSA